VPCQDMIKVFLEVFPHTQGYRIELLVKVLCMDSPVKSLSSHLDKNTPDDDHHDHGDDENEKSEIPYLNLG